MIAAYADLSVEIYQGDALSKLAELPEKSVRCCVTSPPYWGLRDYRTGQWVGGNDPNCEHKVRTNPEGNEKSSLGGGQRNTGHAQEGFKDFCPRCGARRVDQQLGMEKTPAEYVQRLADVFDQVRRVLTDDGTLWLNLGDSYHGSWGNSGNRAELDGESRGQRTRESQYMARAGYDEHRGRPATSYAIPGLKPKDLVGIPWRVAFELQARGWYLRSDIIWHKPNPMPESVTDRPTKSHEYIFLLTKSADYYYDAEAIKEKSESFESDPRAGHGNIRYDQAKRNGAEGQGQEAFVTINETRNKRSVWTVTTKPYGEAHFATFPPDLIEPCILAGSSEGGRCSKCHAPYLRQMEDLGPDLQHQKASGGDAAGKYHGQSTKGHAEAGVQDASEVKARILEGMRKRKTVGWAPSCSCGADREPDVVLDPFMGSGTTAWVARKHGRRAYGCELNHDYIAMAARRLVQQTLIF